MYFFWGEWPSNFTLTNFEWTAFNETHTFRCSEQAFMWAKAKFFSDQEIADKILNVSMVFDGPLTCKRLGRKVKNYDNVKWDAVRYKYMYEANWCKYTQDKVLQNMLLDPQYHGKKFVEASPYDKIWGIGLGLGTPLHILDDEKKWKGKNLLGQVLTQVANNI